MSRIALVARPAALAGTAILLGCSEPTPPATPSAVEIPTPPAAGAAGEARPASSPSPSPSPDPGSSGLPAAAPSPPPLPGVLLPGELPLDTASLLYLPENGPQMTVEPLQATCTRYGDSLGLFGSSAGPLVGRYQLSIAPFRGDGVYRTSAASGEIGGSVSIAGALQLFVGPPFESVAEVARGGALGRLRFSGTGVNGRPAAGILRWECSGIRPEPGSAPSSG